MEVNIPGEFGWKNFKRFNFQFNPVSIFPIVMVILGLLALNSYYTVKADEVGVVQRLGRYVRTTGPGLHFKIPVGVEKVWKVKVTYIYKEEFGFRTKQAGVRSLFTRDFSSEVSQREGASRATGDFPPNSLLNESLMLTGDLNAATVEWTVQFKVKDPVAFTFRIRDPHDTIRDLSEVVVRQVVGDRTINEVLTIGREEIKEEVRRELQVIFDSYKSGIDVLNVVLKDVHPPDEVKASFNEVNEARQEREKMINQAWEEYNRVVPRAKGEAEQKIREAEGYALERVNQAEGDAQRFLKVWESYQGAEEVTRRRLYLESMKQLLPKAREMILIDQHQEGFLPFMDLAKRSSTETEAAS